MSHLFTGPAGRRQIGPGAYRYGRERASDVALPDEVGVALLGAIEM
ncbi:hypothetical protein ACQPZX_26550 [Actinoplanes sp. CA-142083]